ncbi:MAG: ATP-binding protein [Acidimicrobiaceae bacterium]
MSIRTRFLAVISVIMTVTIGTLLICGYLLTSRLLLREVDRNLDNRVQIVSELLQSRQRLRRGDRMRNPITDALLPTRFDAITQVISSDGEILIGIGEIDLPVSQDVIQIANNDQSKRDRASIEVNGENYRMLTVPIRGGGALQIAILIDDIERAKSAIQRGGLFLAILGMFGAIAIAWISAQRVSRPIQDLADAAAEIARTGNLQIAVDVGGDTEIRQLTASFNAMTRALQSSRDQQKQLVQDASHEFRTPLTSLRANSELLQRSDLDQDARTEVLRDIRIEIDELTSLTSELSALATDQKTIEDTTTVDLGPVIEEIVDRARRRYPQEIKLNVENSVHVSVRKSQFDRALSNLIDNASKFSPRDRSIELLVRAKRIEVVDHGPGVADAEKSQIFNRFFRATAMRSLPGSGLGLAIVKQFVDDHEAKVAVADTPGGGATFIIQFKD